MSKYTAHFHSTYTRAVFDFTAKTPQEALELARAKYNEDYSDLDFVPDDHKSSYLQEISIAAGDFTPALRWQMPDYRLREVAPDLLKALEALLPLAQKERDRLTTKINEFSGDEDLRASDACTKAATLIAKVKDGAETITERDDLIAALDEIEGQAVCVNMDGDEGNERMLKHIYEIAHKATTKARGAA